VDDHSVKGIEKLIGKLFWCACCQCNFVCDVVRLTHHRDGDGFSLLLRPYYGGYPPNRLPACSFSGSFPHAALALALQEEDPETKYFEGDDPPARSN